MKCIYLSFLLVGVSAASSFAADPAYPYGQPVFDSFVRESFRIARMPDSGSFYRTMNERAKAKTGETWDAWIERERKSKAPKSAERAKRTGAEAWRRVKKTITKFSLDRGFEFVNVVKTNERQCFLQAVLIAGALQREGFKAGVVMVWRNPHNQTSNNGHAVTVLHLDAKTDILVDASETEPHPEHTGLFMRQGTGYRYVVPVYGKGSVITGYRPAAGGSVQPTSAFDTLDVPFLESQFDYYRGERAPDGILAKRQTPQGLAASAGWLRRSLKEAPGNPLSRAVLSDVLVRQGKLAEAERERQNALAYYGQYGWTPARLKQPVVKVGTSPLASASTPGRAK